MRLPAPEESYFAAEGADRTAFRPLQSNHSDKTSYSNDLAESVEHGNNQHLQQFQATSSNGLAPNIQMEDVCRCGATGIVGELCGKCGSQLIPF